jgi:hypothetical protein
MLLHLTLFDCPRGLVKKSTTRGAHRTQTGRQV